MKPISAAVAASKVAAAKEATAAMAAEEAETSKRADELKKILALRDRALCIALMRAAVDGKYELIWKDDQADLSQLCKRGLWVYENGAFDWIDVWERLREWHLYCLDTIEEKWREDIAFEIKLTDAKALGKLFGGSENFYKLHRPFLTLLFNELKKDSSPLSALHSPMYRDAFEELFLHCLQSAWREAVRGGVLEPNSTARTFWQYDEIYGGEFINELQSEAQRLSSNLQLLLNDRGSPIYHFDEFEYVKMGGLHNLGFDPKGKRVVSLIEGSWPIFQGGKIIGSGDSRRFKGEILHPAITQHYSERVGVRKYKKLSGVRSLRFHWVQVYSTWRPFSGDVDDRLLNWLGGIEGQRFIAFIFGLIQSAALAGRSTIKVTLQKRTRSWSLNDAQSRLLTGLPPSLLKMLLRSYGYITHVKPEGRTHEVTVKW